MNFKYKLQRFLRRIAIPNLMYIICFAQGLVFVADLVTQGKFTWAMAFDRAAIMSGEVWRLLTFIFLPINNHPFWIVISILFYISVGRTVENAWGADKLTHFILIDWLLTIAVGFIFGWAINYFIFLSLILVYGTICPREQVNLYMVLPIEVRWLAIAYGIILVINIILGNMCAIPPIITYLLFFGKDEIFRPLYQKIKFKRMFKQ